VFKGLQSLKELQLGSNRISEIEKRAFANLFEVTVLDLSDTLLETIPIEALQHLPNLADLNLANNNIKIIVDQSFTNSRLSILDLSGNIIERIHEKAVCQVSSVRQLNLQDNELYKLPS
jgi:Leucine-rich repeat (LRR) protein